LTHTVDFESTKDSEDAHEKSLPEWAVQVLGGICDLAGSGERFARPVLHHVG
jgi:hypothetical protein